MARKHLVLLSFITSLIFTSKANALYAATDALNDILSEELTYVGSYIPKYSISGKIPVCVFRNSKVLVKYTYCVSYTIPAGAVTIYSKDAAKGSVNIYAETYSTKDITQVTRSDYYDVLWYNSTKQYGDEFDFNTDIKYFQKYDERDMAVQHFSGCVTAKSLENKPNQTACSAEHASELDTWGAIGYSFWKSPDSNWYKVLKLLKQKVPKNEPSLYEGENI